MMHRQFDLILGHTSAITENVAGLVDRPRGETRCVRGVLFFLSLTAALLLS